MCHKSKILLIIVLVFFLLFFFSELGFANHEFYLVGANLHIPACSTGGVVEVDMMVNTDNSIAAFICALRVTGTANPVLDTVLTGSLSNSNPPAFYPPSVVNLPSPPWRTKIVNPYGQVPGHCLFSAIAIMEPLVPPVQNGLFFRMFLRVDGTGTVVIDTMGWPTGDILVMCDASGPVPVYWKGPLTFNVTKQRGDASGDCKVSVSDVVYLINYLFKGGPRPDPLWQGDVNCDEDVNVIDVVYLVRYLFMGGTPPC